MLVKRFHSLIAYCWKRVTTLLEKAHAPTPIMRSRLLFQQNKLLLRSAWAAGSHTLPPPLLVSPTIPSRLYHSTVPTTGDSRISSSRAAKAVSLLPSYLVDARAVQKYSPETPHGALQLSVAENQMLEDLLVPSLMEMYSKQVFPPDAIYYQPTHGRPATRKAMAHYLQEVLGLSRTMDPDGIVLGAGCNAVLENLCITLAEPGEGVLIPTPYYAAFEFDLGARAGKFPGWTQIEFS